VPDRVAGCGRALLPGHRRHEACLGAAAKPATVKF